MSRRGVVLEGVRGLVGLGSPLVLDVNPLYVRRGSISL
jgi:hypothetical protein